MWLRRRRPVALLAALAAALCAGSLAVVAPGAGAQQTDKQRQLQQGIAEKSKAVQAAEAQAQGLQAEKARLDGTLGQLQAELAAAQAALATAQAEVERLNFESAILVAEIEETQRKLEDARDDAKTSAVLLYKRPNNSGMLELIGSTDGAGDVVEAQRYLDRVGQKRRNDLARADRLKKTLDAQKAQLEEQQRAADAARDQAAARQQQVESLVAQQQATLNAIAVNQASVEATKSALVEQIAHDEADLAAESARVTALLQSLADTAPSGGGGGGTSGGGGGTSGGGGGGSGALIRPVGGSIVSGFGTRSDPISGASAFHSGLDFAASCGTPIRAAGNGVVVSVASDSGGYGNYVVISHGGGLATLYGHQQAIAVGNGQAVAAGQVIGYVGSTGKSTGCHLHFEVRVNGNPVNPLGYL